MPFFHTPLSQLRITLLCEMPVQVDGEPWIQPAGEVIVLRSALKVYEYMLHNIHAKVFIIDVYLTIMACEV